MVNDEARCSSTPALQFSFAAFRWSALSHQHYLMQVRSAVDIVAEEVVCEPGVLENGRTFVQTPVAIASRAIQHGTKDLAAVFKDWEPWQPPKGTIQGFMQGGTLIFEGDSCVWSHRDKATADHANMEEVCQIVEKIAQREYIPHML